MCPCCLLTAPHPIMSSLIRCAFVWVAHAGQAQHLVSLCGSYSCMLPLSHHRHVNSRQQDQATSMMQAARAWYGDRGGVRYVAMSLSAAFPTGGKSSSASATNTGSCARSKEASSGKPTSQCAHWSWGVRWNCGTRCVGAGKGGRHSCGFAASISTRMRPCSC